MLFAFHLLDRPDSQALRQSVRPAHKDYLAKVAERIAFAGPLLDEQGAMCGSLLVIDFDDAATARAWLAGEPFTRAGLYQRSDLHRFDNLWPQRTGFPPATA